MEGGVPLLRPLVCFYSGVDRSCRAELASPLQGSGFSRAVQAERQGGVEVDAEIVKETRVGAYPDHNR